MEVREGTVIQATLRLEDMIPAFYRELERIAPAYAKVRIEGTYKEEIEGALAGKLDMETPEGREWAHECADMLIDDLTANAPEGYYFGAHPGNGSDFGWWRDEP